MRKIFTRSWQFSVPLIASLLGFGSAFITQNSIILACIIFGFFFGVVRFFRHSQLAPLIGVLLISLCVFWFSVWRVWHEVPAYDSVAYLPQGLIALEGRIVDYQEKEDETQLLLNHIVYGKESRTDQVLVTIQQPLTAWQVGDRLRIACHAEIPKEGSYKTYLASKRIYLTCRTNESPVHLGRDITFSAIAWKLRNQFETRVNERFAEPYATLLTGLYIGDVSFSTHYQSIFKATGITHIVAASGYNVSVTALLMMSLLAMLGIRRQDAFVWLVIAICCFIVISGASAPVVRAGIMGSLVLLGKTMGRASNTRNILLLTVVSMLFVQPMWLLYDVGFQLSVLSTWGLIYLSDFFGKVFVFIPETLGLRESMATTISATLVTMPLLLGVFSQISVLSPISNLLILPALPYILVTGVIALFAPISLSFLYALPWLGMEWILRVTESLSSLPFAFLTIEHGILKISLSVFFVLICLLCLMRQNGYSLSLRSPLVRTR